MMSSIHFRWWSVVALCALLSGCGPQFEDMAELRTAYAEAGEGPIVVAVVDDRPEGGYLEGVRLGAEQINASAERLLGRPIELLVRRGRDDVGKMLPTIRGIAANPRVAAILGHRTSAVAVPASITYEKARLLFMPPFATSERLTLHGFDFVLRMLPGDKVMTAQIASLADLFGYRRIAVLHDRSESSRAVAFLFEEAARRFGMEIAFQGSFFASGQNYRRLIAQLKGLDFDAVFLSTETRAGARMLRQLRGQGIRKPILGTEALGTGPLIELAGEAGERTIVPTLFNPDGTGNRGRRRFIRDYEDAYGKAPGQAAAQGYDSLHVLATIVARSGSTEPRALATTAHFSGPMAGITGIYAYDPDGNIYGKSYRFQVLRSGRWWPLPGVTLPFLLAGSQEILVPDGDPVPRPPPIKAEVPEPPGAAQLPLPGPALASTLEPADSNQYAAQEAALPAIPEGRRRILGDRRTLAALMRGYWGARERDQAWLGLAHEILKFHRLGLVVSPMRPQDIARVELARSVGKRRGFEVAVCELPVVGPGSEPDSRPEEAVVDTAGPVAEDADVDAAETVALEKAALRCYSRLARSVDSLFVVTDVGLRPTDLKRLDHALLHFGVSTFTFQEARGQDYGLTLALVRPALDLQDPTVALRFNGLLKGIRVHELNRRLSRLPWVAVDLDAARSLGLFADPRELTLISDVLDSSPSQPALSLGGETN